MISGDITYFMLMSH